MADLAPADMISKIEAALLAQPAGVITITYADGRSITYDRSKAIKELQYWKRQELAQATSGLQMCRLSLRGDQ